MFFLAMGDLPGQWYSVLALPTFLAAVGAAVWVFGRIAELKKPGFPWKWFGVLPLAFAVVFGMGSLLKMQDFLYRDLIEPMGTKVEIAHYAAFVVPLLVALAVAGWEFWDRLRARAEN